MKINSIWPGSVIDAYKSQKTTKTGQFPIATQDSVSFSEEALSFSAILAKAKENIETRSPAEQERIDQLSRDIKAGIYRVDAQAIATKITNDYLEPTKEFRI